MEEAEKLEITVLAEDYSGYNSPYIAQHGICFYLKILKNSKRLSLIFDLGTYFNPILFNSKIAGVNLKNVSWIFLSHCHFDHSGGLAGFLRHVSKPVNIIAHPQILREHRSSSAQGHIGVPREAIEAAKEVGANWIFHKDPKEIVKGVWITGEVERVTDFERVDGFYTIKNGELVKDGMLDDMAMVIKVGDRVIIVTGCSHSGIVNIVKHVEKTIGRNVTDIIGGLHLIDAGNERILKTISFLKNLNLKKLYCGHCTGFKTECLLDEEFREKFSKLHCGMKMVFK